MATERITIIVSETGAVSVKKDIASIGPAANSSATAVDSLKSALAAYIGLQAAQKVGELADAGTRLTNTLKQAGLSGQGLVDEQQKLFDIATANGQNVNELSGIFQKLTSVQGQLGASGKDVDKVLQGIASSMKLSNGSAEAQAGSLQQLSQLFGGVNVQAQEYNSLIDGAYPLLQAVAAGSDRFGGSVAALTQAVKNSSVTTKEFFAALVKGSDANIALAASFNLTIGQALTNFNTKLIQGLLYINQTTGAFNGVAIAINFVANNLGVLLAILSPLVAALTVLAIEVLTTQVIAAFNGAYTAIGSVILQMGKLTLVLLANPFTLFLAAGVVLLAFFVDWQKAIQTVIQLYGALKYAIDSALGASNDVLKGDVKIVLDAKQAAADIVGAGQKLADQAKIAITGGAGNAAPILKKAVGDGGVDAANNIKAGSAEAAAAVYGALNGVAQTVQGAIQAGSDYQYNQVTGAYTKASDSVQAAMTTGGDSAGNSVKQAMVSGGQSAAQSLTIAGQTVSGGIADVLQASAFQVAAIIKTQLMATVAATVAAAAKDRADARATLAGINGHGSLSGGSGGSGASDLGGGSAVGRDPHYLRTFNTDGSAVSGSGVGGDSFASPLTIVNKVDPTDTLTAINTQQGSQTIVNVIKGNASQIKALLGIN